MDCCNYVPYKNPYYGPGHHHQQFFEQVPQYPTDYYGPSYPEFYGNTPYYPAAHPWQCASSVPFPDYVYNPKEARMRKAMRDASRERAMSVAPATRPGRRAQPWVLPEQEEQYMITPTHSMRGMVGSPMCGTGFPIGGQYMHPMQPYSKPMHMMPQEPNGYLQVNPIAQLQQQTEMWHQYHQTASPIRASSNDQYLMPTYHHPHANAEIPSAEISADKLKRTPDGFHRGENSPECADVGESVRANIANEERLPMTEEIYEGKVDPLMDPTGQQAGAFLDVFQESVVMPSIYEKVEDIKVKKLSGNKPHKSLPDFNEAFGSTERGRFQSPPDPRLPLKQGYLDYFIPNNEIKFEDYHI